MAGAQRIGTRKRRSLSLKPSEGRLLGPAPKAAGLCDIDLRRSSAQAVGSTLGLNSALPVGCFDRDLARLCLLGDRNVQSKHAIVVAGRDLV